ncbi:MAG: hypothetical protein P8Z31_00560 [Gammaproteobacteria bacterium]|jgi:hypothetical protein
MAVVSDYRQDIRYQKWEKIPNFSKKSLIEAQAPVGAVGMDSGIQRETAS